MNATSGQVNLPRPKVTAAKQRNYALFPHMRSKPQPCFGVIFKM